MSSPLSLADASLFLPLSFVFQLSPTAPPPSPKGSSSSSASPSSQVKHTGLLGVRGSGGTMWTIGWWSSRRGWMR